MGKGQLELTQILPFTEEQHRYLFIPGNGALVELDETADTIVNYLSARKRAPEIELVGDLAAGEDAILKESIQELITLGAVRRQNEANLPVERSTSASKQKKAPPFPLSTLVLNLAQDCNLACRYCYAQEGTYGQRRSQMSWDTAKIAVDFLFRESGEKEKLSITFFGGEPLLNMAVLQKTVAYAREKSSQEGKEVDFNLTTNGTLLDGPVVDYLVKANIGVSVSIDGPPELHDYWRPLRSGGGSYELLSPGLKKLLSTKSGKPVGARVTLSHNFGSLQHIYQHLRELGFWEVGFAPVTSCQEGVALTVEETGALLKEFSTLAQQYVEEAIGGHYPGFSNLTHVMAELFHGPNRQHPCGAGLGFLAADTGGELYMCHRFTGQEDAKVGDIWQGIDPDKRWEVLKQGHISSKPDCLKCPIQSLCAGGCYYEAQERHGNWDRANSHYCTWLNEWILMALKAYVKIARENPQFFNRVFGQALC